MNEKTQLIVVLFVIVLVSFVLYKIFAKLGLIKTSADREKEVNVEKIRESGYFSPMYYKTKAFKPMSETELKIIAKDLRKATKGFGTDEELIYSSFKRLLNKVNISQLAEVYYKQYQKDLRAEILDDLREKEMSILQKVIDSLPNF